MSTHGVDKQVISPLTDASARKGMTIVEVVIALSILALAMAGGYALIVQAAQVTRVSRDQYVAVTIANNRVERAHNFDYDDLHLLAEDKLQVNANGVPDEDGDFRRSTLITPEIETNVTLVQVEVEIKNPRTHSWDDALLETVETKFSRQRGE